jgi:transcriptional regulator GlxA family with amidase domain
MKRTLGFVVFPGFQILDLVAITVFELANALPGGPFYDITMLSEHGGAVTSSAGVRVDTTGPER